VEQSSVGTRDRRRLECQPNLGRETDRLVAIGPVENDEELLAAEAGDDVAGPEPLEEDRAERAQDLVPQLVTVQLVERPEVVEVEEDHRDRWRLVAGTVASGEQSLDRRVEVAAVEEAGQRVAHRRLLGGRVEAGVGDRQRGLTRQ
jgi:hypothetical protein